MAHLKTSWVWVATSRENVKRGIRSIAQGVECSVDAQAHEQGVICNAVEAPVVTAGTDFLETELSIKRDGWRIVREHREFHLFDCSLAAVFQARLK